LSIVGQQSPSRKRAEQTGLAEQAADSEPDGANDSEGPDVLDSKKLGAMEPKAKDGVLLSSVDGAKLSSAADGANEAEGCADANGAPMAANAANVAVEILSFMVRSSLLPLTLSEL
jgi:hypothetical protein